MRIFSIFLLLCLWPLAGRADDTRFYAGIHGGLLLVQDSDISGSSLVNNVEFDPGFAVGGVFGYKMEQGVRLEAEYTYRRASADDACFNSVCASDLTGLSADGSVDAHAIMANAWYEPRFGKWRPYIGGGAGLGILGVDVSGAVAGLGAFSYSDTDTVFAYQGGAGVGYELTSNNIASIGYRYWATTDPKFSGVEAEVGTHTILLELRNTF